MFKLAEEFTFKVNSDGKETQFIGQLIFRAQALYEETGTLYTMEEIGQFMEMLNSSITIPEKWSLEKIAELIFVTVKPVLSNLYALNLFLQEQPQRVAEYSLEESGSWDHNYIDAMAA